jgi:hypothetical protein
VGRIRTRYLMVRLPNPPVRTGYAAFTAYGSRNREFMLTSISSGFHRVHGVQLGWVGARRVTLRHVSSRPPFSTGHAPFKASGAAPPIHSPSKVLGAFLPISFAPRDSSCTAFASAKYLAQFISVCRWLKSVYKKSSALLEDSPLFPEIGPRTVRRGTAPQPGLTRYNRMAWPHPLST